MVWAIDEVSIGRLQSRGRQVLGPAEATQIEVTVSVSALEEMWRLTNLTVITAT